jgi:hypothetical protein
VNALVTQVSDAAGNRVDGPAVDVSVYGAGAESAVDAVARGFEALGITPPPPAAHEEAGHGGAESGSGDGDGDGDGAAHQTPASE